MHVRACVRLPNARVHRTWIEYKIHKFSRWNGISAMPTIFSSDCENRRAAFAVISWRKRERTKWFARKKRIEFLCGMEWARACAQNPCKWAEPNPIEEKRLQSRFYFISNSFNVSSLDAHILSFCHMRWRCAHYIRRVSWIRNRYRCERARCFV